MFGGRQQTERTRQVAGRGPKHTPVRSPHLIRAFVRVGPNQRQEVYMRRDGGAGVGRGRAGVRRGRGGVRRERGCVRKRVMRSAR